MTSPDQPDYKAFALALIRAEADRLGHAPFRPLPRLAAADDEVKPKKEQNDDK